MPTDFETHINKMNKQTVFKTGNYNGFLNARSIFSNSVALIGLGLLGQFSYIQFVKPVYDSTWKPGAIKFWNFVKSEWENR